MEPVALPGAGADRDSGRCEGRARVDGRSGPRKLVAQGLFHGEKNLSFSEALLNSNPVPARLFPSASLDKREIPRPLMPKRLSGGQSGIGAGQIQAMAAEYHKFKSSLGHIYARGLLHLRRRLVFSARSRSAL